MTFIFAATTPFVLAANLAALGTHVSEDLSAWHAVVDVPADNAQAFIANYNGHVQYMGNTVIFG